MSKFEKAFLYTSLTLLILFFLWIIISGIWYWTVGYKSIRKEIDSPLSFGKNWCGMLIYREKLPLNEIPEDCLWLLDRQYKVEKLTKNGKQI